MSSRARQLRWAFFAGLTLFLLSTLTLATYSLWRLRADAITNGLQVSALHSRSFENFLTQSLRVAEQTVSNLALSGNSQADRQHIRDTFATTLRHTPFLRSLSLQDDTGRIVISSNPANVGVNVATQAYLPPAEAQEMLRIGQPWSGRDFASGQASTPDHPVRAEAQGFIPVTRSLMAGGHRISLLMAINPDYFVNHMSDTLSPEAGSVEVLRYDGTLLMGTALDARPGTSHDQLVQNLQLATTESGAFEQSAEDGRVALTAFFASRLYPFVVITRLDRDQALQQWRTETKTLVGLLVPALLVIALLAAAFYRRQMDAAEQRAQADRLLRINATVFDASSESIIITDRQANIISVNAAFTRTTGYTEQEVKGRNPRLLNSGAQDKVFYSRLWAELLATGQWQGELVNRSKAGQTFDAHLSINSSRDGQGRLQHYVGVVTDITEARQARLARDAALNRLSKIASRVPGVLFELRLHPDGSKSFPYVSDAILQLYNNQVNQADVLKDASSVFALIEPDDQPGVLASLQESAQSLTPWQHEYRVKLGAGNTRWLLGSAVPQRETDGSVLWHGIVSDITERKQNEEKLELAASVFHNSREGIMITRTDGSILDVNEAFTHITGYAHEEVVGRNPRLLSSGRQDKTHYEAMWRDLKQKGHWYGEVWNRRKNGEVYAEMLTITTVRDAHNQPRHFVALFSDITAIKAHEQQLDHIAHYDALTNLPNRVLLADRLHQALLQVQRRGQRLAVVFLDLDGFKGINDSYGHEAGDHLLMAIAHRMRSALRDGDTLARIGGDEFVAVLVDLVDSSESMSMLNRLLAAAAEPVPFGEATLQVSASLGVTLYPQEEDIDADQLQRQADQAMYQAKVAGKNRFHFFDAVHDRTVRDHHESLEHIRRALANGELVLYYQPKVNMRTGLVIGVEALIRWHHPERGLLAPALFLPVIENHALAVDVGEWVIHAAMQQMQQWQHAGLRLKVSVNVSARQLQQRDFVPRLQTILAAHPGVAPAMLELEVLETSALEDIARVTHIIEECRLFGVRFALDDFGTGYSSLTYLKRLPVALLKIDQSFIRDMLNNPDDMAILQAVMGLAKAFQCQVIAEGVETVAHGVQLMQMGCDLGQGYGISRPMPAHEVADWVKNWRSDPAWHAQTPIFVNTL
ncbi:EAL domain-containing protein [Rhodoferax sp.]|uniref:bifunctional diguanylate cyclase/phosphodiesterase n=1 Tax=Rhodoferax sp. TaxID=50421 RepID=UPI0026081BA9|nr:EAL domain-containing protein [Rhodoferax sp.]MDD2926099.1 EAL domain-containing protein [Rhodoferax sp.]